MERGCFKVNLETLETSEKGIFAGGDNASGPASVIEAVAAGKKAAESIGFYLNGKHLLSDRFENSLKPVAEELLPDITGIDKKKRAIAGKLETAKRIDNFNEIESAFSADDAMRKPADASIVLSARMYGVRGGM
jgi:pyruvate/2-oxoglutarate dehydrogenase complex dihydrolipoamide dehydrogenase (E3) component